MKSLMAAFAFAFVASTRHVSGFHVVRTSANKIRGAYFRTWIPLFMSTTTASTESCGVAAVETNPMLDMANLPRFSKIEPNHVTPAISILLTQLEADFAKLESKLEGEENSYDNVLPAVEKIQFPLGYAWGVAGHLNGVKNGEELRAAYEAAQPGVVKAMTQFSQSKALYDALSDISETLSVGDNSDFKMMQKARAVENSLESMKLGGVGLEGEDKERFNEMKLKLADLSTKFSNNVLDATKAFSLTVDDPSIMQNVPSSAKAMWAQSHAMHLQQENVEKKNGEPELETPQINPEEGPWRITLDAPSYIAAMQHIPDRSLRKKVYFASITRCNEDSEYNNVDNIYEILSLKKEMSGLLGFDNFAEQSLSRKMAPDVDAVTELSDLIADKALPAALKELEEITDLAREQGGEEYSKANVPKLTPWDVTFWSERLRESKFSFTEEELRPYFALPAVLEGMFGLVERIFGVTVEAADREAEVWNKDVSFYNVYDKETEKHIASFYLDPYSRPADKRGGAWMDVCIGKSEAVKRNIPVAYLTCNGSPPVGDTPSLMTFREVETLFHEFGHGLQHMLTEATVGDVAGINGVEWDAVELPSQFMENWCYDKPTVYGFAKHYQTGEPLPEELFEKLVQQKTFSAGLMACRQLYFGQLDMELHANYDTSEESIFDVQRRVALKYSPHNMPLDDDRFLCTFGHIFGGGYAAGYYSYKWAEVMSADAFGAFEEVGLHNESEVQNVGKKFRDTVLALGGGVPPMQVFKKFRGREPSPDALLRHNGLL